MTRAVGACMILAVYFLASACAGAGAQAGSTNMLLNSSFESGRAMPDDWDGFGLCARNWEFKAHDGERCISITGDGADAGWWYAKRWVAVQYNRLYRVSYWVRSDPGTAGGKVLAGLNLVNRPDTPDKAWKRVEFFFRSPSFLPDPQFRLGQKGIGGTVYFDEAALHPAIAVHRSRGMGGGVSLGAGERITEGRYTAIHDMHRRTTTDCRFLDSYTASFDNDRWILDGVDEVVYRHEVYRLGVGLAGPSGTAVIPDETRASIGARRSVPGTGGRDHDPRYLRNFAQGEAEVEVAVDRCGAGLLRVEASLDGKIWAVLGVIAEPRTVVLSVPREMLPAFDLWVRLKSDRASHVEVNGYRYSSRLAGARKRNVTGASSYLALLRKASGVEVEVTDIGDLAPGGRSEVKLAVVNEGPRLRLEARVVIESDGVVASSSQESVWLAPGSAKRLYLPYEITESGEYTLCIFGRDGDSGRLLFSFKGCDAEVMEQLAARSSGRGTS